MEKYDRTGVAIGRRRVTSRVLRFLAKWRGPCCGYARRPTTPRNSWEPTMFEVVKDVARCPHVSRMVAEIESGRLAIADGVRLSFATGRVQGAYMSSIQLLIDTGIVRQFNTARRRDLENDERNRDDQ